MPTFWANLDPTWSGSHVRQGLSWFDPTRRNGGLFGDPGSSHEDLARQQQEDALGPINRFLTELEAPLNFEDPKVKAILQSAQSNTALDAQNRGIQGGLALSGQQAAYINSAAQLQGQRDALRARVASDRAGYMQRREETDYQRWLDSQQRNQGPFQAVGSILGGAGGLGLGLGASLLSGGLATPLIPGLVSGGSQIGAGLGGNFSQMGQQPYQSYRNPYTTYKGML